MYVLRSQFHAEARSARSAEKTIDTSGLRKGVEDVAPAGGLRVFAARVPAASDLVGIYKDVGAVLMTLSTSSVPLFRFFDRKIFPPVSST